MKTDFYTKAVLTVIAICLTIIVFKQVDIIPKAYASSPQNEIKPKTNYGLIPVNADGSINVRIISSCKTDVNITEVRGSSVTLWGLPVKIID